MYDGFRLSRKRSVLGVLDSPRRALEEAKRDQGIEEVAGRAGVQPEPLAQSLAASGFRASSVKTSISTALRSVFEAQKPRPTCMMCSGVGCSLTPSPPR